MQMEKYVLVRCVTIILTPCHYSAHGVPLWSIPTDVRAQSSRIPEIVQKGYANLTRDDCITLFNVRMDYLRNHSKSRNSISKATPQGNYGLFMNHSERDASVRLLIGIIQNPEHLFLPKLSNPILRLQGVRRYCTILQYYMH